MVKNLIVVLTLLICSSYLQSQTNESSKKSYLTSGVSYSTNSVWQGRSDSIITPGVGVSLGYHLKSGFYVDGGLSIIPSREINKLDLATLSAGYSFSLIKDVFTGNISYVKNFYSQYSTQVASEVQGGVGAELAYDFSLFQLGVNTEYSYGTKKDIGLTATLGKSIEIEMAKSHSLNLSPSLTAYAGTQNLYGLYLVKRPKKANKGKKSGSTTTSTTSGVSYSKFNMLDIDLSVPLSYEYKRFTFGMTPTFAIPLNVQPDEFTGHPFYINFSLEFKL
jgi:hypothetical protein